MRKDKIGNRIVPLCSMALLMFCGCEKMGNESPTAFEAHPLAKSSLPASLAAFPAANGKIVFESYRDGPSAEIYAMNPDGSGQTNVTNNPGGHNVYPARSPDGTKILFCSHRDGNAEIYVMNADGSGQTRLTNHPAVDCQAAWSPDGSKIAFQSDRDVNTQIYVMNADGSGQTRLSNNSATEGNPDWSPDGSKIAFDSDRDSNVEIYVMNDDGSGQTRITNNAASDNSPAWSPDGAKIVFNSYRDNASQAEIYVMNADGSGQTNLSNSNSTDDGSPAWSPDGTKIVFHGGPAGGEIYVMNADGSGVTRLTFNSATDVRPDWQPLPNSTTSVTVDIKPGSFPNSINPKSKGVIPVAILTTGTFDATTVDPLSVKFGSDGAVEAHGQGHLEDVDGDGDLDLVLHFKTQATGIQCGDTSASLTGKTFGGQDIIGSDPINTVGCN